jgi:hypothetical protein
VLRTTTTNERQHKDVIEGKKLGREATNEMRGDYVRMGWNRGKIVDLRDQIPGPDPLNTLQALTALTMML